MSTRIRQKNGWESYKAILALAIPIIIQNLFSAAVSSADVIMLNSVGQSAVSASSLAVQYTNVLYMIFYGLGYRLHHALRPVLGERKTFGDQSRKVGRVSRPFALLWAFPFSLRYLRRLYRRP